MKNNVKILAMYLPQYHEFEQNNKWWGKGFTEWTNMRNAKALFKGHRQPRIPLDDNYYNLLNVDTWKWQAELAKKYHVYGFCIYHYWFEGIQMMEKPMEIFLNDKSIDIKFCYSWANHTWTKAPGKKDEKVLIRQTYGDEKDWIKHFKYLNRFFKDDRYIKIDNKPVIIIYNAADIDCWENMKKCWDELAYQEGFNGLYYVLTLKEEKDIDILKSMPYDAGFEYQPTFGVRRTNKLNYGFWYHFKYNVLNLRIYNKITRFSYDRVWNSIINNSAYIENKKIYLGAFNDWDTSARWGDKGNAMIDASPAKFARYLKHQLDESSKRNNEFIFITAWNEWSEGAYLEPDTDMKYQYLEAVKNAYEDAL